jgi:hypothetical protein
MIVGVISVGVMTVRVLSVGVMTFGVLSVGVMTIGVLNVGVMTVGVLSVGVMTSRFVNPRDLIITEAGLYTVFGPVYISINRNFKTPSMILIKSTLKIHLSVCKVLFIPKIVVSVKVS